MNLDERMEQSGTYSAFRTSLDIGMGAIYIIMGAIVLSIKYFGVVELSPTMAIFLGVLLLAYGAFRIYRGIIAITRRKDTRRRPSAE